MLDNDYIRIIGFEYNNNEGKTEGAFHEKSTHQPVMCNYSENAAFADEKYFNSKFNDSVCFKKSKHIGMKGSVDEQKYIVPSIAIARCDDKIRKLKGRKCASQENFEEFIRDLENKWFMFKQETSINPDMKFTDVDA